MGIYDRDYYRRDMRTPPEDIPGQRTGLSITAWLIIINVVVFILSFLVLNMKNSPLSGWCYRNFFLWPVFDGSLNVLGGGAFRFWQPVTSMFLHSPGDIFHILFNMWFLWMFGKGIERLYGPWNFLGFYMTAGVIAGLLWVLTAYLRNEPHPAVGASGAVMGVVVLYAFHFPRQKVYIWGILPVLIWQLAVFFVGLDLLYFLGGRGGNVANAAHLGGAAFGAPSAKSPTPPHPRFSAGRRLFAPRRFRSARPGGHPPRQDLQARTHQSHR
ncbi:MAG: rhomboid family intramembrane serine protease [Planctomycetota bacterium]|jgi:membrane associated rhomboid family serine protease